VQSAPKQCLPKVRGDTLNVLSVLFIAETLIVSPASDGNEGIDFSINFLPPFRFGEILSPLCGGETRFPLGEVVLTQLLGELGSFRISGISSSIPLTAILDDLQGCTVVVAFEADEREFALRGLDGLGGFALEKFGSLSRELQKITRLLIKCRSKHTKHAQGEKYVISKPGKIKRRCYWDKVKEGVIFALYICFLLTVLLFLWTIFCLFTFLFHFFSEFSLG